MKNIFKIFALSLISSITILSCRNSDDIPEDIHEHEEIEKMELKIVDQSNTNDTLTVNYIGGVADKKIVLENGKSYFVDIDFFVGHDGHYDSVEHELEEERDEHFITYQFAGVNVNVLRRSDDIIRNDGKKLGLRTLWTVNSVPNLANVNIKLVHGATSVDDHSPSPTNQLGTTVGGGSDVNALIGIE